MSEPTFRGLGASAPVADVLAAQGIETPFEIQGRVLPDALAGQDVLAKAPTGSGKTLAFGIPLVELVGSNGPTPAALVLVPTRQLAAQVGEVLEPLAAARGLRVATAYGGVGLHDQAKKADRSHLLVATPGRLEDLANRKMLSLGAVSILVLDEADRMLDMGFQPMSSIRSASSAPGSRRRPARASCGWRDPRGDRASPPAGASGRPSWPGRGGRLRRRRWPPAGRVRQPAAPAPRPPGRPARGSEPARARPGWARSVDQLDQRDAEGERLAGAGGRLCQHVLAGEGVGTPGPESRMGSRCPGQRARRQRAHSHRGHGRWVHSCISPRRPATAASRSKGEGPALGERVEPHGATHRRPYTKSSSGMGFQQPRPPVRLIHAARPHPRKR